MSAETTTTEPLMSFYDRFWNETPIKEVDIKFVHNFVRSLSSEAQTYAIRKIALPTVDMLNTVTTVDAKKVKERQDAMKYDLPGVTLSGTFKTGKFVDNLIQHSGYILIDFDEIPKGTTSHYFELLKSDPYTHLLFVSVRGFGLKGAVKIDGSKHLESFEFLEDYYLKLDKNLKLDTATKNVNRFMSLPHDPDCYYNPDSQRVEVEAKPQPLYVKREFSYNEVELNSREALENTIIWCNKSQSFTDGNRNNYTVLFAGACNRAGVSSIDCMSYLLSLCKTTTQERAVQSSVKAIYRKTELHGVAPFTKFKKGENVYLLKNKDEAPKVTDKNLSVNAVEVVEVAEPVEQVEPVEVNELTDELPMNSEKPREFYEKHQFFIKDGCYYTKEFKHNRTSDVNASNFTMKILYKMANGTDNSNHYIRIQLDNGDQHTLVLSTETIVNDSKFGARLFEIGAQFFCDRTTIKRILHYYQMKGMVMQAREIQDLGYQREGNFYALSNCIIENENVVYANECGMLNLANGNTYYLPPWAKHNINNDEEYGVQRKFYYKPGNLDFQQWSALLYDAYGVDGLIGVLFTINTIFCDVCRNAHEFFPFMFLYGAPGTGKSSFVNLLMRLFFPNEVSGTALQSSTTPKGIQRELEQNYNTLAFLKEFRGNTKQEFLDMFLSGYDGALYTNAAKTNNKRTVSRKVTTGIIVDGNAMPTQVPELYDRFIILDFNKMAFTPDNTRAYDNLKDEMIHGFGKVLFEIASERETYATKYAETYNATKVYLRKLTTHNIAQLPTRTQEQIAFLLTALRMPYKTLKLPWNVAEVETKIIEIAFEKCRQLTAISAVNIFWDAVTYAKINGKLSNYVAHYDPVAGIFYISIANFYPVYVEYCQKTNNEDKKVSELETQLKAPTTGILKWDQKGRTYSGVRSGIGSCYHFKVDRDERGTTIAGKEINLGV